MAKLQCIATCYMLLPDDKLDRFEDEHGDERDVYRVDDSLVAKYLASGNFKKIDR